ncbi:Ulp1 protease family C-terminal catalytic domain [Arabidopsis suecica]|uniref:Ulp1 protease family C-terminal catalytic domain n=1 Tax=Arabidopsis suecica TaxID=45249 RepID=A0A8T1XQI8_ARASU|nr:Ulp1 protease family C-terminal catalytic domain [Arabidopsis suecica]
MAAPAEVDTIDFDTRLPPRLFATDRYPEARLNIYSRPDILTVICDVLQGTKEMETLLDSCFGSLFSLRPLRFSLVEFGNVTGLPCGEFPEEYDPDFSPKRVNGVKDYWDVLIGKDKNTTLADLSVKFQALKGIESPLKLPLALLLIVDGVLIANNQTHRPTYKYVQMLENIESFLSFPWGRESFLKTIQVMSPGRNKPSVGGAKRKRSRAHSKIEDPIQLFAEQMQQQTIAIYGFPLGLQLLAYRNISGLLGKIPGSSDERTFLEWHSIGIPKNNLTLNEVHILERAPDLVVTPFLFVDHDEDGWGEWDDEVRDKKVVFLIEQIRKCHEFTKKEWPGGYAELNLISVNEKDPVVEHKKHIVNRKRKHTSTPSKGSQSKSNVGTSRRGRKRKFELVDDDEAGDIKLWVNSRLDAIRHEFAENVQKLRGQNRNLLKKIKALRSLKMPRFQFHKFSRARQSTCAPSRKVRIAAKHPNISESPENAAVGTQNIPTPPSSPLTSMHEEENAVSGEPSVLVDDYTWRLITSQQMNSTVNEVVEGDNPGKISSPQNHLNESPSKYLSADSTEDQQSGQPIYDTESKLRDEELNIGDLSLADNVDTLVQSVCKSISPTIAAAAEDSLPSEEEPLAVVDAKITPQDDLPVPNLSDDIISNSANLQNTEITPQEGQSDVILPNFVLVKHSEIAAATEQEKDDDIENHDDDEDSAVETGDVVDVSDSSPARERKPTSLSDNEAKLVALVSNIPQNSPTKQHDLLPRLNKSLFKVFMDTLRKEHLTRGDTVITNKFLVQLAQPTNWVDTMHMEVLGSFLNERHRLALSQERAVIIKPWLGNYLQGKYSSFLAAKQKLRVQWNQQFKRAIPGSPSEWFEEIDLIFMPMIWKNQHWVGLAINLGTWCVDILDPNYPLNDDAKVEEYMAPILVQIPYIINKFCKPRLSQEHGLAPFRWTRMKEIYINERCGDCGPVAMKLIEIYANGGGPEKMALITDEIVDDFRDIVRRIGISGFRHLGPFIAAGPELSAIVFSDEVLQEVGLEEFVYVPSLCLEGSPYRPFLLRCLHSNNNTAKYIEGLRLAALVGPSVQSLDMLGEAAIHNIHSYFAFGIFYVLCGNPSEGSLILQKYLEKFQTFEEAINCADQVMTQISDMGPTGKHLYRGYRGLHVIPPCGLVHYGGLDVCPSCFVLFYVFQIHDLC